MKIWQKLVGLSRMVKTYKNWHLLVLDCLGLLREGSIIYVFRSGVKLEVIRGTADRSIMFESWRSKIYNPPGFDIKENYIVIDIGAHKGYFSLFAASSAKGVRVYAYEPCLENFEALKRNIELNNFRSRIKAFNLGVAGEAGRKRLYICEHDAVKHSLYTELAGGNKSAEIDCVTLREIFEANEIERCDFLKLDCEGAEYEILLNTPSEILKRVRKICLEYHLISGFSYTDLVEFLEGLRFEVKTSGSITDGMLYARNTRFVD